MTIFLTLFFTYGLLVVGDYFFHLYQYSERRTANDISNVRKQTEDRNYLTELKNKGFNNIILPWVYDEYTEISKKIYSRYSSRKCATQ